MVEEPAELSHIIFRHVSLPVSPAVARPDPMVKLLCFVELICLGHGCAVLSIDRSQIFVDDAPEQYGELEVVRHFSDDGKDRSLGIADILVDFTGFPLYVV